MSTRVQRLKVLSHTVNPYPGGWVVKSGTSGETYLVVPLPTGGASCSCPYGQNRPAPHACSHVEAVIGYVERLKEGDA